MGPNMQAKIPPAVRSKYSLPCESKALHPPQLFIYKLSPLFCPLFGAKVLSYESFSSCTSKFVAFLVGYGSFPLLNSKRLHLGEVQFSTSADTPPIQSKQNNRIDFKILPFVIVPPFNPPFRTLKVILCVNLNSFLGNEGHFPASPNRSAAKHHLRS